MISADQWRAYNEAVESIREGARSAVEGEVAAWLAANPGATVAEAREEAKRIMRGAVQDYDRSAAALAAEWYDAQGRANGVALDRAVTAPAFSEAQVDRVARYKASRLAEGDLSGFAAECGSFAANSAMRSLNDTILRNVRRDRKRGVRYARVTSGRNTCAFCLMLAGRGAVYWTRESAGGTNRWHNHCTCKVVPSYSGDPKEVLVEGHDPAKIEARLSEVERLTGFKRGTPEFSREVELRDPDWLFGEEAKVVYDKPEENLLKHEAFAVDRLRRAGYSFSVLNEDEEAPANIDLIFSSGQLWEMKDIGDGKHSIEDQLKSARSKWRRLGIDDPVRVVMTGTKMTRDEGDAIEEMRRRSRYFDELLFIRNDGTLVRISK